MSVVYIMYLVTSQNVVTILLDWDGLDLFSYFSLSVATNYLGWFA